MDSISNSSRTVHGGTADWDEFHRRFIHGTEPLPLAAAFSRLGLVFAQDGDGAVRVEVDPAAPEAAHVLRHAVTGGNR